MKRLASLSQIAPVLLVVAGFVMIFAGWNGAAGLDYTQGQIPYLISGGLAGVALVLFGAAALVVRTMREGQQRQLDELKALHQLMARSGAAALSSNGAVSAAEKADLVMVGAASFHLETCRLVVGRSPVALNREQAIEEGLKPCRICNP